MPVRQVPQQVQAPGLAQVPVLVPQVLQRVPAPEEQALQQVLALQGLQIQFFFPRPGR